MTTLVMLACIAGLFVVFISMAVSAHNHTQTERDLHRSNAAVLAEYKSMCRHRPHFIVDHPKGHHDQRTPNQGTQGSPDRSGTVR